MSTTRTLVPVLLSLALVACGDEEVGTRQDTVQVLETTQATDTAVATTTSPPDTNVTETSAPTDTSVVETTTPVDTAVTETVAETTVSETVAETSVAETSTPDVTIADTSVADTTTVADTTSPADTTPGPQACPAPADETLVTTSTVFTGRNFTGAKDALAFTTDLCSDPPDSAERTYRFELTTPTEIYAETACDFDCELVLTKDGCDQNNVVDCSTTIGDEIYSGTLGPGTYRFFIEGDNPGDPDDYDFMLNFNHTSGQATCDASALDISKPSNCRDPFFDSPHYLTELSSQTSAADVDDFFIQDVDACSHDDSHVGGAPDKVYSFTLSGERDVEIDLEPDGWDALLAVSRSPCGATSAIEACSDDLVGGDESLAVTLGAGTWYIVIDGFGEQTFSGGSHGSFDLAVRIYDDACD